MPGKAKRRTGGARVKQPRRSIGGHAGAQKDIQRLERLLSDLDERVRAHGKELSVQFQRLAELQAVIDRMQLASRTRPAPRAARGEGV